MPFLSHFCFIDKIIEVEKNKSLKAVYKLDGSQEFLKDHFDGFPVMPGVLMLETLKQAASWLMAWSSDFKEPFSCFSSVSDVKFGQFIKPGSLLQIDVNVIKEDSPLVVFKGRIDFSQEADQAAIKKALSAIFTLKPLSASTEEKDFLEKQGRLLYRGLSV